MGPVRQRRGDQQYPTLARCNKPALRPMRGPGNQ